MKERHNNNGLRKLCKHGRRQWPKCPCPWHFNFMPSDPTRRNPASKDGGFRFSLNRLLGRRIESKSEAETEAERLRLDIKEGRFGRPAPIQDISLEQLAADYLEREVEVRHPATRQSYVYALNPVLKTPVRSPMGTTLPLGQWRCADITKDAVERFREVRLKGGTGKVGVNRSLRSLRALLNWGIGAGHLTSTPFRREGVVVVKLEQESKRTRRLRDGEEEQLLAAASPDLKAVVVAALESGMRRGEITGLQWYQVEGMRLDGSAISWAPKAELFLPKTKTKTKRDRRIPISTRLRGILEMRRLDPSGQPLPPEAFVFGSRWARASWASSEPG